MPDQQHAAVSAIDQAISALEPQVMKDDGLDVAWQLVDLLQASRAIAKNIVDTMRAEHGRKCPVCTRGGLKLRDVVRASNQLQKSVEQVALLTGKISSGSQVQVLVAVGASSMEELQEAMSLKRAGRDITLEAAFYDALDLLKLALMEHPEWSEKAHDAIYHGRSIKALDEGQNGVAHY
jgi:hypothetical protein